jgi:hypothetical protein
MPSNSARKSPRPSTGDKIELVPDDMEVVALFGIAGAAETTPRFIASWWPSRRDMKTQAARLLDSTPAFQNGEFHFVLKHGS